MADGDKDDVTARGLCLDSCSQCIIGLPMVTGHATEFPTRHSWIERCTVLKDELAETQVDGLTVEENNVGSAPSGPLKLLQGARRFCVVNRELGGGRSSF